MYITKYLLKYLFILILFSGLVSNEMLADQHIKHQALQTDKEENRLSILSWNIKMHPPPYGWFYNSIDKAENIIKTMKESSKYDVILFQEAFSYKIRNKIYNSLKDLYPHQIDIKDETNFYKMNSGLWVISSIPITLIDNINFTELRHNDWLSSKGAYLYSVIKNRQEFYIINTHMQADYRTKYSDIRTSQYTEIHQKLILPNENSEIPLILCGDLNISKPSKLNQMLEKLNFMNGPLSGKLKHTSLGNNHELLDYILVKSKKIKFQSIERRILNMSVYLNIDSIQLSDHYPIEGILKW